MATDYARWQDAEAHCRLALIAKPDFDVPSYFFDRAIDWNEMIKSLRKLHGNGLYEAQAMALRDPRWRAWVARSVRTDRRCEKQVRSHIAAHGDKALVMWEGDGLGFRMTERAPRD